MRNPFELPEDVALVDMWREVVVDAEKSIELLQQGYNPCGVNVGKRIVKYRAMVLEALQKIETEMKANLEGDAMKKFETDGGVHNDKSDGVEIDTEMETAAVKNEEGARVAKNEDSARVANEEEGARVAKMKEGARVAKIVDGARITNEKDGTGVAKKNEDSTRAVNNEDE